MPCITALNVKLLQYTHTHTHKSLKKWGKLKFVKRKIRFQVSFADIRSNAVFFNAIHLHVLFSRLSYIAPISLAIKLNNIYFGEKNAGSIAALKKCVKHSQMDSSAQYIL